MQIGKHNFFNGLKNKVGKSIGSRLLNIQNVSVEDEGEYVCEVKAHSGDTNRAVYVLNVFSTFKTNFILQTL